MSCRLRCAITPLPLQGLRNPVQIEVKVQYKVGAAKKDQVTPTS
jgi:hypothetical protein